MNVIVLHVVAAAAHGGWEPCKARPMLIARAFSAISPNPGLVAQHPFLADTAVLRFTDGDDVPCAVSETVDEIANLLDARRLR